MLFGAAGPSTSPVVSWLRWEMTALAGVRPIRYCRACTRRWPIPRASTTSSCARTAKASIPGREGDLADIVGAVPELSDRTGRTLKEYGEEGASRSRSSRRKAAERIARFACQLARKRKARGKPGKVTCVTKSNVLPKTDGLYQETVQRVVSEAGDLQFEHFHVDDAARRLVRSPSRWTSSCA